jgi:hypothetical protein
MGMDTVERESSFTREFIVRIPTMDTELPLERET